MELKLASKEYQFETKKKEKHIAIICRIKKKSLFGEILGDVLSKMKIKNLNARCEK